MQKRQMAVLLGAGLWAMASQADTVLGLTMSVDAWDMDSSGVITSYSIHYTKLYETDAVALKDARSCSTYTTASIGCMLSHDNADALFGEQYEPLPSYLQRFGVDVIWRTRNWGA